MSLVQRSQFGVVFMALTGAENVPCHYFVHAPEHFFPMLVLAVDLKFIVAVWEGQNPQL